jgi:4-methyl-5(b-hydroxyethyl)-thiazole monophosphate biosynthesis
MVILPGGMPGTNNLNKNATVHKTLDIAKERGAYIAAICAAPIILGDRGDLNGKNAVCYPGFEDRLIGAKIEDTGVCVDGKIITARGMGVADDFALCLVALLKGQNTAKKIAAQIMKEDY